MRRAVMARHVAVFGFEEQVAIVVNQDGAEGMVAVSARTAGHFERAAQEMVVAFGRLEIRIIAHQCPDNQRPANRWAAVNAPPCGGRSRSGRPRWRALRRRTDRGTSRPDDPTIPAVRPGPR